MTTRVSSVRTIGAAVIAACALALPAQAAGQIPPWKTKLTNAQATRTLQEELFKFDDEGRGRKRPPADAKARLQRMQAAANRAKAEVRSFAARLKAAGEVEAFNAAVLARAKTTGSAELIAELRSSGGAHALLLRGDRYIDEMIADRRKLVEPTVVSRIEAMLGVAEVHALKTTLCAAFWFTISFGYGEAFAYRSCYY
jgi:hypothetical protein